MSVFSFIKNMFQRDNNEIRIYQDKKDPRKLRVELPKGITEDDMIRYQAQVEAKDKLPPDLKKVRTYIEMASAEFHKELVARGLATYDNDSILATVREFYREYPDDNTPLARAVCHSEQFDKGEGPLITALGFYFHCQKLMREKDESFLYLKATVVTKLNSFK